MKRLTLALLVVSLAVTAFLWPSSSAQSPTLTCYLGINTGVTAQINITELTGNSLCFTVINTSTGGTTGKITSIGLNLPSGSYSLTSQTNPNYRLELNVPGNASGIDQLFEAALLTGPNFNGGGNPNNGIIEGASASFCLSGNFTGLTASQIASGIFLRFQDVNPGGSDVARSGPCPPAPPTPTPTPTPMPTPTCPTQLTVPVVTHGPDGIQRVVQGQDLDFIVTGGPGAVFNIFNDIGSNLGTGAIPGLPTQGFSTSAPNTVVTAESCTDRFWDVNFVVRQSCITIGDRITISLRQGNVTTPLITLVTEAGGVQVTQIIAQVALADRSLAFNPIGVGSLIPFSAAGGTQTPLITFNLPGSLMTCGRLVAEVTRGESVCNTSLIFSDVVVIRQDDGTVSNGQGIRPNGTLDPAAIGQYFTGLTCAVDCPPCPPPTPTPTPMPTPFCFSGISTGVRAEVTVDSFSSSNVCFTIRNTSTAGTTGTITNIGFDLPSDRPNNYALTMPTGVYFVVHDLNATAGAQNFVDTFDFVLHNKTNGNPTFGGGHVADGIPPGQSATFCLSGDFSDLTAAQFAAAIYPRFQDVSPGGSDVARIGPCQ